MLIYAIFQFHTVLSTRYRWVFGGRLIRHLEAMLQSDIKCGLGLSGDHIVITDNKVVKTCRTNQDRFLRNIAKQQSFKSPHFRSIPITDQGTTDGYHWIEMPYLNCDNALVWLSKANIPSIDRFIDKVLAYLRCSLSESKIEPFDYKAWQDKIDDLIAKITNWEIIGHLSLLRDMTFTNDLYYGNYHGDLTLTNLLVSNTGADLSVDVIDFLDCFIHSPIMDFVKLRQDSKHLWTFNLLKRKLFDTNKVLIALHYMDHKIEKVIENDPILNEYYLPFQILNLIRILPYNKDSHIEAYLSKEIDDLGKSLEMK
jgi:hypothetical protein